MEQILKETYDKVKGASLIPIFQFPILPGVWLAQKNTVFQFFYFAFRFVYFANIFDFVLRLSYDKMPLAQVLGFKAPN